MLPKTYDRWSDEAKEERMRQNRILWDPTVIANQGNRTVPRIRQTMSTIYRSRSETRMHHPNQEPTSMAARSISETRGNRGQDRPRASQRDQSPQRSSSETRCNPRIHEIVKDEKGTRSKSEDRAPLTKPLNEPINRENTQRGREEDRRVPSQVRKSARLKRKESEQEAQHIVTGGNSCGRCLKKVANGVHCKLCLNWYHFSCEETTEKEVKAKYKSDEDDYVCLKHKEHPNKEKIKQSALPIDTSCKQEGVDFTVNNNVLGKVPPYSESPSCIGTSVPEFGGKVNLIDATEIKENMKKHKDKDPPINKVPLSSESPSCKETSVPEIEGKVNLLDATEIETNMIEQKDKDSHNKRKSINMAHEVRTQELTRKENLEESEESESIITGNEIQSQVVNQDQVETKINEDKKEQITGQYPIKARQDVRKTENSLRKEKKSVDNIAEGMLTTTIITDGDIQCDIVEEGGFQRKDLQVNTNSLKDLTDERKRK